MLAGRVRRWSRMGALGLRCAALVGQPEPPTSGPTGYHLAYDPGRGWIIPRRRGTRLLW